MNEHQIRRLERAYREKAIRIDGDHNFAEKKWLISNANVLERIAKQKIAAKVDPRNPPRNGIKRHWSFRKGERDESHNSTSESSSSVPARGDETVLA